MLFQFAEFGCLEDVALGLRWRPADFAAQVRNRANALAASDVKPRSTVIVARSGSAPFFADLFAVWTLGGTAACIDPALTKNEIETLVEFVQPSALLVGDVAIAAPGSMCPRLNPGRGVHNSARTDFSQQSE